MILQELCKYYDRLVDDPDAEVAPYGHIVQGVAFEVVIGPDGTLVGINDIRETEGARKINKRMILPGKAKPTGSGLNPSLCGWDRTDYMLGYLNPDALKPEERSNKLKRCLRAHHEYKDAMLKREATIGAGDYTAFCRFLRYWTPEMAAEHPILKEVSGLFGVVRFTGEPLRYLHDLPQLHADDEGEDNLGICLVTGETAPIARTHDVKLKGVAGAQSSGAVIVGFNLKAFESYCRTQSYNAPTGKVAAFKYATALNKLLERDSGHNLRMGDTTVVFWADAPSKAEDLFEFGLAANQSEDTDTTRSLAATLRGLKDGTVSVPDADTGFHVLGLSPNASRLSVRFWYTGTVKEMLESVVRHQRELDIVHSEKDRDILPGWLILAQTARESKDIPPLLGGALLRAILTGGPYPQALYAAIMRRIRADCFVTYPRVAAIKAVVTRNHDKEGLNMLNAERPEIGYQLGRLFAALEKAQEDALPGINATIKDRYFGAASATPGAVFPRLLRMSQHHVGKLEGGRKVNTEKRIQEICGRINNFPMHLDLVGQGLFDIGYYHQRQDFFTPKNERKES